MADISEALQHEGDVTQEVIQPAISGAEITRLSMYKANALKELAAGQESFGQGIASGISSVLRGIGAGDSDNMAREGSLAGRSAVTRDSNGDIQVQPPTGELFGLGGKQYSNAVSEGTQQQITTNLRSDLNEIAAKNEGNPEGLKAGISGYLQGHTRGLGAGVEGQTALLDARDYGQKLYDYALTRKGATDIGNSRGAFEGTIEATQRDLLALAGGGMGGSDEFAKTLGKQSDAYNALANPTLGVSTEMIDQRKKSNALAVTAATINGSMATAFQHGGINAAQTVIPSIDNYPGASEADKVQLRTSAQAYVEKLQASNKDAIAYNAQRMSDGLDTAKQTGVRPPIGLWQDIEEKAINLGDPSTAIAARNQITIHNYAMATSGLSPSQHDAINGVGQPKLTAADFNNTPPTPANFSGTREQYIQQYKGQNAAPPALGTADSMAPFRNAIASIESRGSGGYKAVGPVTGSGDRAYGAYQVMGANIPSWTKAALGYSMTKDQFLASPAAQDAVFNHQFGQYVQKYGTSGAASAWFTGRPGGGSISDVTGTTADKYVSMFNSRVGNASAPEGGELPLTPGGARITWDDIKNNPGLGSAYAQAMANDQKVRTAQAETLIDSSTRALQNNIQPSPQTMVQIEQLATPAAMADNPKLAEKYDEYAQHVAAFSLAGGGGGAGGQSLIDQARAATVNQPDITQRQTVDNAQKLRDASQSLLDKNPVAAGLNMKAISRPPAPLNPNDPQSYGPHFADNAAIVRAITAREPGFDQSAVFPQDKGAVQDIISGNNAQQKIALLGNIANLPSPIREATLATIAGTGAEGATMAQAGAIAQANPEAAQDILQGQAILKSEPRFAPKAAEMLPAFAKALPPMDFPVQDARGRFLDAAKAYYAAQSAKANDTTEDLNSDRWSNAMTAVTGGILDHNGSKIIAPSYGMSQAQFDAKIASLRDADLAGANLSGLQFPAISLAKASYWTSNPYYLRSANPDAGTYIIKGGTKTAPTTVKDANGDPFVLNLRAPAGTMQAQQ